MWGNFIGHADIDLIAAAVLYVNDCWEPAHYHAQQAVEKYIKALAIAIADPDGTSTYEEHKSWCEGWAGHDLVKLATRCGVADPYYTEPATTAVLEKVQEWSTATRYPWVETEHYRKSMYDLREIEPIVRQVRGVDLPLVRDDYWLSIVVRGRHHLPPHEPVLNRGGWQDVRKRQLDALNAVFSDVRAFVRW